MATIGRRTRRALSVMVLSTIGLLTTGCGNPGEGTVVVSPEARARIRGEKPPAAANAKGKAAIKPTTDLREKLRRKPED